MALPLLRLDQIADGIFACVCASLNDAAVKVPGFDGCPPCSGVVPGAAALDSCTGCGGAGDCSGQLSVGLRSLYPSNPFPRPYTGVHGTKDCLLVADLAAEFLVTYSRCVPVSDDMGNPPSPAVLSESAAQLHTAVTAVMNALDCCLPGLAPELPRGLKYTIGTLRVLGPQGGCVGAEVPVTVLLQGCGCPEDGSSNPVPNEVV